MTKTAFTSAASNFDSLFLCFCALTLLFTGLAFVTKWRILEKESRARHFCFFVMSTCYIYLSYTKNKGNFNIGISLLCALGSWGLSYFYNLMEYLLLLPALASMIVPARLLFNLLIYLKVPNPFENVIVGLSVFFGLIAVLVFIWRRNGYLSKYRIVFACFISLSASVAVPFATKYVWTIAFFHTAIIGFTALVAKIGIKSSEVQNTY